MGQKIRQAYLNCHLEVRGKTLSKKNSIIFFLLFFGQERSFSRILYCEQKDSGILIKNSCKVVKIAFYVSRLTFWGIFRKSITSFQHLRKMSEKLSNYGPKHSGRFFKNFHLKSLDKHLEDFFEKSAIFSTFLDFILKNLLNFCRKSSASLSEMHYRCPGEHFFWKNI